MAVDKIASQVGNAWDLHRQGRNDDALNAFEQIVRSAPQDIDVHFGLGLVQRALGQTAAANASFEQALRLAEAAKAADDGTLEDRLSVIIRMLRQRQAELGAR